MKKCSQKTPEQLLTEAGYKLSEPRFLILDFLKKSHGPLSAQEISKQLKSINLASVYRSLGLFTELEIVNSELIGTEKKYCLAKTAHHHIICVKCGYLERVECNHAFTNIKNFTNIKHQLTLSGLCHKCA
jgi:Fur family ferric uptake transcriptional regulator